jgi:hypothetical protein
MTEQAMAVQVPASQDLREVAKQAFIDNQRETAEADERQARRDDENARLFVLKAFAEAFGNDFTCDDSQRLKIGSQDRWTVGVVASPGLRFTAIYARYYGHALFVVDQCPRCGEWCLASHALSTITELGAYLLGEAPPLSEFIGDEEAARKHLCHDQRAAADEAARAREEQQPAERPRKPTTAEKLLQLIEEIATDAAQGVMQGDR